jgi:arylsulfatase A-like enzyme
MLRALNEDRMFFCSGRCIKTASHPSYLIREIVVYRCHYLLGASCLFLASAPLVRGDEKPAQRPNVLFIAIDDLNDWIGVLGKHPQAKTPNLDKLAQRCTLFTRAYCAAPLCNPSRTALLTGKRPSTTGVYNNDQPWRPGMPDVVTLPEYFRAQGYRVLAGGKIFHYQDAKCWDVLKEAKGKGNKDAGAAAPVASVQKGKKKEGAEGAGQSGSFTWGPTTGGDDDLGDGKSVIWAGQRLKEKYDRPFFLAVGFAKPHLAWHVPQKYFDMHPLDKIILPKVLENDLDDVPEAGKKFARAQGDHKRITEAGKWKEAVQAYLACCSYVDVQVGRLIAELDASPYAGNTIIVLWSDHGWSHGQKEHWRKFSLWEQDCRVVFMIAAPGVTQPGQRCERTVSLLDIYPTLNDLCHFPAKKDLEGHSLLPLLRDPAAKWNHPAITTYQRNNHSIRTERWRYIRYADGSEELYDHDNDPLEWKNLAKDPTLTKIKQEMSEMLPRVNAPDVPRAKAKGSARLEMEDLPFSLR